MKTLFGEVVVPAQRGEDAICRGEASEFFSYLGGHLGQKGGFQKKILYLLVSSIKDFTSKIVKDLFRAKFFDSFRLNILYLGPLHAQDQPRRPTIRLVMHTLDHFSG